jgi:hypothetical protein
MRDGTKSAITIGVLGTILAIGAAWGWSAATKPFPGKAEVPTCVESAVSKGEKVYPDQVVVSVFNAGQREGLAGRTMGMLVDEGFREGDSGNAPARTKVSRAEIWTDEPGSPAVQLVATWLGRDTRVVRRNATGAGVVVLVGDRFDKLAKGRKLVVSQQDIEICSPPPVS